MNPPSDPGVWVFNYEQTLPSAVSSTRELAEMWIAHHALDGLLTWYPIDVCAYDWAVANDFYKPKPYDDSRKIGRFTGGHFHCHYEQGVCIAE